MQSSAPLMSLVCKIQGYQDLNTVMFKLNKAYEKFNPNLITIRADVERDLESRRMRQRQDEAYQQSLQRDRAKKIQRQLAKEQARKEAELQQLKQQWLKWRKSTLLPESSNRSQTARIAMRLPNGQRIQFKFNKDCKIEEIYAYIECNYLNNVVIDYEDEIVKPIGFEYDYEFKIYSILPRQEIPVDYDTRIGDSELLSPSGNLIVEMDS
ncbi:unnamed protein product [Ambrosiozyma monospora]|uniref:Unnamed protein product n=1 Tax=Ambrosiozyma monospora TaxID=43982 RepID=A0ACB5T1T4_AMBMO|nr:unnamed protein product [Ambrosiozyma monospora]